MLKNKAIKTKLKQTKLKKHITKLTSPNHYQTRSIYRYIHVHSLTIKTLRCSGNMVQYWLLWNVLLSTTFQNQSPCGEASNDNSLSTVVHRMSNVLNLKGWGYNPMIKKQLECLHLRTLIHNISISTPASSVVLNCFHDEVRPYQINLTFHGLFQSKRRLGRAGK